MSREHASNFGHLKAHDEQLVRLGLLAERYFADDPNTCLLKLRQLAEALAQLAASRIGIFTGPDEKQADLLRRLQDHGILPREVSNLFHEVRKAGNDANHKLAGDHRTALSVLRLTWQLSLWFHRTFKEAVYKSGPFIPPAPPVDAGLRRASERPPNLADIRRTSPEMDAEFKRSRLRSGDILLSVRGTVGRLVSVPPELERANITQDTARLSIQSSLNAAFVLWYLRSELAQSRMRRAIKGVAVRGINIGDVRALQVPVPSRAEQDEIVRRVESHFDLADALEAKLTAARAGVGRLTPALLSKAFRGELVPQDPDDEPASAPTARVRSAAQPATATSATKGPARKRAPRRA